MSSPRVTLAIAAYNGERYLAEAIESCLAQDHPDFELLIVDDASTDSTPDGDRRATRPTRASASSPMPRTAASPPPTTRSSSMPAAS